MEEALRDYLARTGLAQHMVKPYLNAIDSIKQALDVRNQNANEDSAIDPYLMNVTELDTLYRRLGTHGDMHELNTAVGNGQPQAVIGHLKRLKQGNLSLPKPHYFFVGASYGQGSEDQSERFLAEGVWQNGYQDKYLDAVRSMQPGDKIAIKSSYTRKRGLPFDNQEQSVSVMGIKAIGVVTKNHGDGRFVDVDWEPRQEPVKEWYFYTNRSTIWRVSPDEWMTEGLVNFTFNSQPQDVDRFRKAPYWKERFGDTPIDKQLFKWTQFYEAVADKLITHKDKRQALIAFVTQLADKFNLSYIKDKPLDDICPFTVIGLFNRGMTDTNRKAIAKDLADYLGVTEGVPNSFEGIPILNNQKSWFFGFEDHRQTTDIESLWRFFETALQFSGGDNADARSEFGADYDQVTSQYCVGWNLTMALYWIRPWNYVTLDGQSQLYITKKLGIDIGKNGPKRRCSSKDYLKVLDELALRFQEEAYPVHSFPELSLEAFKNNAALSTFEQHVDQFKLVFPDFVDFNNTGNDYNEIERDYKVSAIEQAQTLKETIAPDGSNAADVFLQLIELANFFSWRNKQHIQGMMNAEEFVQGISTLIKMASRGDVTEQSFNDIKQHLLAAEVDADLKKDRKLAANMFLQIMLFPFFLFYPKQYFAMKSSHIRRLMQQYDLQPFKKGDYINFSEFQAIQSFGRHIKSRLEEYTPKDFIDVQSFLWVVENHDRYLEEDTVDDNEVLSDEDEDVIALPISIERYDTQQIIDDGFFGDKAFLDDTLERLRIKKNLILQGPPGTGKTWLAKRLAFALMGQKNDRPLRAVQFHPNLSYEDFVRGWRPSGDGTLTLADGPFLEMINAAKKDADTKHVVVIEEINRGNPAQIFGEMLTLLEADKRTPTEALALSYRDPKNENERVYVPDNLYVIGTMNVADRSLALVDLALRRRFAFINLKPMFGVPWQQWVHAKAGIPMALLEEIETRLLALNNDIENDRNLGAQFKVGHSYVTPAFNNTINDAEKWYKRVVQTEIGPLLDEYWFDDLERSRKAQDALIAGI